MQKSLKLTDNQLYLLETMVDNNVHVRGYIVEATMWTASKVGRMLVALQDRGLVEGNLADRWSVTAKGAEAITLSRKLRNGHATFEAARAAEDKRGYHEAKVVTPSVDDTMRYENGDMDEAEVIEFFQRLVDTGLAWQLQGSYGRTANDLLRAGLISVRHSSQWR